MDPAQTQQLVLRQPIQQLVVEVVQGPNRGLRAAAASDTLSVGTAPDNDLVLADPTVSRYHLEFRRTADTTHVVDLGSTNGLSVGKVRIERGSLSPGAQLQLGETVLRVSDGPPTEIPLHEGSAFYGLVGNSVAMRRLMALVERAAHSDISVLVLGETGCGKEVVAKAIHEASARADYPFETVDCGAIAPTLIASEFFGHEAGAFTGAEGRHVGVFERADGGTVFLDEIGELPSSLQTTLLGVLERRAFRRLGGGQVVRVNVRLIAATHRDLRAEVNRGSFRSDLYYRLASLRLQIPPLRERLDDVPHLVAHFLGQLGIHDPPGEVLPADVLERLVLYQWPGNVRELRNFVEHMVALGEAPAFDASQTPVPVDVPRATFEEQLYCLEYKHARAQILASFERSYLARLLERSGGNVAEAARASHINRTHLFEMLKRHGLR